MAKHVFVEEQTGWHCVCCGKNEGYEMAGPPKERGEFKDSAPRILLHTSMTDPQMPEDLRILIRNSLGPVVAWAGKNTGDMFYEYPGRPQDDCPVNTFYENTLKQLKPFPRQIQEAGRWAEANDAMKHNIDLLLKVDAEMPDGLQATLRRFQGVNALEKM